MLFACGTLALKIGAVPMVVCTTISLVVGFSYHGDERHCGRFRDWTQGLNKKMRRLGNRSDEPFAT